MRIFDIRRVDFFGARFLWHLHFRRGSVGYIRLGCFGAYFGGRLEGNSLAAVHSHRRVCRGSRDFALPGFDFDVVRRRRRAFARQRDEVPAGAAIEVEFGFQDRRGF